MRASIIIGFATVLILFASLSAAHTGYRATEREMRAVMDPDGDGECNKCFGMMVKECFEEMEEYIGETKEHNNMEDMMSSGMHGHMHTGHMKHDKEEEYDKGHGHYRGIAGTDSVFSCAGN